MKFAEQSKITTPEDSHKFYINLFEKAMKCNSDTSCQMRQFCTSLIDNSMIIIAVWSLDGTLIKFNNYGQKISGYFESEVVGEKWRNTIADTETEKELDEFFNKLSMKYEFSPETFEGKILCKNKSYIDILWSRYFTYDRDENPEFLVSIGMNITAQKKAEARNYKLAYYDQLTGLPNRAAIKKKMNLQVLKAIKHGNKFAVIFMDLDNFKTINDSLGHTAGNQLLKVIGERLKICVTDKAELFRLGGDEFIILLPFKNSTKEVSDFSQKVIDVISEPITVNEKEFFITGSIGIAIYPQHGTDFDSLGKNADTAMYYAKELGKNRFRFFTQELNDKIVEQSDLTSRLRYGIKNKEFMVYYQPQVNIKTGKLEGMEALVRWKDPKKGMIPPMKFIPIAESTGLIIPIGNLVLREACRQNKHWQDLGYEPVRISVNLSAKQFEQENLVEIIEDILKETGLEPKWLGLEITESIIMKNFEFSVNMLNKLREKGIHVSLDDFGTGYSSLNYLKTLPIDTLKIDKSFVDNIKRDIKDEIIAKAVIQLAHNIGLDVVAEGVEHSEQLNFLKQQECDKVQGFIFSKPLPSEDYDGKGIYILP